MPSFIRSNKSTRLILTLATSILGGWIFYLLHIPLPWLLGPMVFVLIGSTKWKGRYEWNGALRNTGMIIVAYTMGLSFTLSALKEITRHLPTMLLMTVLLLLLCAGMAVLLSRFTGANFLTMLMGSIPGGLSQVVTLAEETKGVNVTVVTVMQVIRLMTIIISIPALLFSPIIGETHRSGAGTSLTEGTAAMLGSGQSTILNYILYAVVCVVSAWAAKKLRFPTAPLLGPMIGTALLQMTGIVGPVLPSFVINGAQVLIGAYLGLLLKPGQFTQRFKILSLSISSSMLLVAGSVVFSFLLSTYDSVTLPTALLSLAPGGMDQMSIMAHEIGADLSIVAVYQLFRLLFIYFAVPPMLRIVINRVQKRSALSTGERL
ncbi:AbrB family transcriptional regulator [Neobacillus mesonae]|nr:AbrB family transcriptional regulator [Neobacillus mesonae]